MTANIDFSGGKFTEFRLQNPTEMKITDCRSVSGGFITLSFSDEDKVRSTVFIPKPMVHDLFNRLTVLMDNSKK